MGRIAYIIHHILAKKEYSDLLLKLKQSGNCVNSGGLVSLACPREHGVGEKAPSLSLVARATGEGGAPNPVPLSKAQLGERGKCSPSVCASAQQPVLCEGKGGLSGSFMGLYPVTLLAL